MEIAKLLQEKSLIETRLEKLTYRSIEIRDGNKKRFIYVHLREDGKIRSKYVGEYSADLYNIILENNNVARAYKKRLREIKKELSKEGYIEEIINEDVSLNIDLAKRKPRMTHY